MTVGTNRELLAGRYRVLRTLGRGGMAIVLLAEDEHLGRRVAVKRLHSDSPDDDARRFAREARLGASLNHPNVVAVYDTVADDEGVLIVMEYVEGGTLADLISAGRMQPQRALDVIADVGAALDHAHKSGVVHRDVKPANVLVPAGAGPAKLADLGIATVAENTRITRTGTVLGTPSYMAPEQLEGAPTTPATDVYALGAVAYEALAGEKARPGRSAIEIAHTVASHPPPDLRDVWPEAPPGAGAALKRAMSREPGERQSSAGVLADELSDVFADRDGGGAPAADTRRLAPTPLTPPTATRKQRSRPVERGRGVYAAGAVLLVALAVAAVVALSGGSSGSTARPAPSSTDATATRGGTRSTPDGAAKPAPPGPAGGTTSRAGPAALNAQGKALADRGELSAAIPVLEKAVAGCPDISQTDPCAYAAFNLGQALRRAGRKAEALPVLQRRLQNPDQRGEVLREIALAGGGAPVAPQGAQKGAGKQFKDPKRAKPGKGR